MTFISRNLEDLAIAINEASGSWLCLFLVAAFQQPSTFSNIPPSAFLVDQQRRHCEVAMTPRRSPTTNQRCPSFITSSSFARAEEGSLCYTNGCSSLASSGSFSALLAIFLLLCSELASRAAVFSWSSLSFLFAHALLSASSCCMLCKAKAA